MEEAGQVLLALELGGRRLVGAPASLALGVLDAGRHPDEDQAAHELGAGQRGVEGEAGAEGVAEEVERGVGHLAEQPSALLQVGGDPGGAGVAGEVHPHEGAHLGQLAAERPPQSPGLGEAVGEHQRRPLALDLDAERGHGP